MTGGIVNVYSSCVMGGTLTVYSSCVLGYSDYVF